VPTDPSTPWLAGARRWLRRLARRAGLRPRRRRVVRHAVACQARLDVDAGTFHVRVCDVSPAGALLVLDVPLEPGARAQLRFPDLPGRPAAWCLVRHASPAEGRVGVEFQGDQAAHARLAEELVRRYAVRPPDGREDPATGAGSSAATGTSRAPPSR
jgi:hypothetical protein